MANNFVGHIQSGPSVGLATARYAQLDKMRKGLSFSLIALLLASVLGAIFGLAPLRILILALCGAICLALSYRKSPTVEQFFREYRGAKTWAEDSIAQRWQSTLIAASSSTGNWLMAAAFCPLIAILIGGDAVPKGLPLAVLGSLVVSSCVLALLAAWKAYKTCNCFEHITDCGFNWR